MTVINRTRYAVHFRAGTRELLNYLATEDFSWLGKALISFQEAGNQAATKKEIKTAREMRTLVRELAK